MKFRHNDTGQIFNSDGELRLAYSNVSFPANLDENALEFANVSTVVEVQPPNITELQRVDYDGVQLINGQWKDVWSIHPKYDDVTEQETWEAEWLESRWDIVRSERDVLLLQSDWTQLADCPLSTEQKALWVTYRQDLRDVPQTQTDPLNIIWPSTP